jgi:hypothetical protein
MSSGGPPSKDAMRMLSQKWGIKAPSKGGAKGAGKGKGPTLNDFVLEYLDGRSVLYWNILTHGIFCTGISLRTDCFVLEYPYDGLIIFVLEYLY